MATMELEALRNFREVAERGSFTAAARRLGLDKSKVSRSVRALEESLGTALLWRSTRSVRLTPEGEQLLGRVAPLLAGLEEVLVGLPARAQALVGEVRLTTTPELAREVLAPVLIRFRARFPGVTVEVQLADRLLDLLDERIDLALRVGRPGAGSLVAKRLGELEAGFYAAPSYVARRGRPEHLRQLGEHEGYWPMPPRERRSFVPQGRPPPPSIGCGDFGFLAALARAGGGVALLPTFVAKKDVDAGALVRVLPEVSLMGAPLYLVSRATRTLSARVAELRRFLIAEVALTP